MVSLRLRIHVTRLRKKLLDLIEDSLYTNKNVYKRACFFYGIRIWGFQRGIAVDLSVLECYIVLACKWLPKVERNVVPLCSMSNIRSSSPYILLPPPSNAPLLCRPKIFGEDYQSWSLSVCCFIKPSVTSISLNQNNTMRMVLYIENKIIFHDLRNTQNDLVQASRKVLFCCIMGVFGSGQPEYCVR